MVDESGGAFTSPEPPPAAAAPLSRPKHRGRAILLTALALVAAGGVGVGAWWAITQHAELGDTHATLETTQDQLATLQQQSAQQISDLESQATGLQSQLSETTDQLAALETAHQSLSGDHEQLLTEKAGLEATNTGLRAAIEGMSADIQGTRELIAAMGVLSTPVSGYLADRLPDDLDALLDELAVSIGWYDTAAEYADNPDLVTAHIVSVLEDSEDAELAAAYQRYMSAPRGSQEELEAFAEWMTRLYLDGLAGMDRALETGTAAVAE